MAVLAQLQDNTAIKLQGNKKFQLLCVFSPVSEYQNHVVHAQPCQTHLKNPDLFTQWYMCNYSKIHADCSIWKDIWRNTSSEYHEEKYANDKVGAQVSWGGHKGV